MFVFPKFGTPGKPTGNTEFAHAGTILKRSHLGKCRRLGNATPLALLPVLAAHLENSRSSTSVRQNSGKVSKGRDPGEDSHAG